MTIALGAICRRLPAALDAAGNRGSSPLRCLKALHGGFGVKHVDLLEVIAEVFALVGTQDAQGQANQGPQVHHVVPAAEVFAEFVNLGMAVMASGNAISRSGLLDLLVFDFAELQALIFETRLQKTPAAAAAVVVGAVGLHVDEIFLAHDGLDHEAQVLGDGVAVAFPHDLAGILDGELDLQVLVPVGVDFQFALPDPLGVVFVDVLDLEVMLDVEFFQSGPD